MCTLHSHQDNIMDDFISGWVGGWVVLDFGIQEDDFMSLELTTTETHGLVVYLVHTKSSQYIHMVCAVKLAWY